MVIFGKKKRKQNSILLHIHIYTQISLYLIKNIGYYTFKNLCWAKLGFKKVDEEVYPRNKLTEVSPIVYALPSLSRGLDFYRPTKKNLRPIVNELFVMPFYLQN